MLRALWSVKCLAELLELPVAFVRPVRKVRTRSGREMMCNLFIFGQKAMREKELCELQSIINTLSEIFKFSNDCCGPPLERALRDLLPILYDGILDWSMCLRWPGGEHLEMVKFRNSCDCRAIMCVMHVPSSKTWNVGGCVERQNIKPFSASQQSYSRSFHPVSGCEAAVHQLHEQCKYVRYQWRTPIQQCLLQTSSNIVAQY